MVIDNRVQQRTDSRPFAKNTSTTIQQYPLERRKIAKKLTVAMMSWTLILGLVSLMVSFIEASLGTKLTFLYYIIIILYVSIFIIQIWYQNEYYNRYFYNIGPDFLAIKKGVIMPHETMLPYEKLQDVYMDQDLFDRMFDLWDVHVSTATAMSGYEAHIDGVNHDSAEKLRELILNKIRKQG